MESFVRWMQLHFHGLQCNIYYCEKINFEFFYFVHYLAIIRKIIVSTVQNRITNGVSVFGRTDFTKQQYEILMEQIDKDREIVK